MGAASQSTSAPHNHYNSPLTANPNNLSDLRAFEPAYNASPIFSSSNFSHLFAVAGLSILKEFLAIGYVAGEKDL